MKTEERKKEDCELLDAFVDAWSIGTLVEHKEQFKADNDLLPKPKLEFNRWIVNDDNVNWMVFYDNKINKVYGTRINCGSWICNDIDFYTPNDYEGNRYATEAEILEKLSAMAEKLGYVEGVEVESLVPIYKDVYTGKLFFDNIGLWCKCETYNILIMENGKWAKIITPNRELSKEEWNERIGEVQVKINELEEKLNELRKLV